MLLKDLIGQLIIDVNFVLLIMYMEIIAVRHVLTLDFFKKIFAVLDRSIY